ncbi:MAG: zinc ribbon domain-containing protein [Candidatus Protochlamydia sp.]|nr:zinc ribbon domain-containing protein [Candidatus Protochlamydia sp.]
MPNYDYHCSSCGHAQEIFQKMSEAPFTECPLCLEVTFKRKPGGGAGLHFKGSGFYITDYPTPDASQKSEAKACCPCGKPASCSN